LRFGLVFEGVAVTEINPYASPIVPDPPLPFAEAGVGVWRDGGHLVMHQKAELPRYCIHTGEPAVGGREYVLAWKPPGALFTTSKPILIPLCRGCIRQFLRLRTQVFAAFALGIVGAGIIFSTAFVGDWAQIAALSGVGLVAFAILYGLYALGTHSRALFVVRSQGDYLWLQDVHPDLLKRLPPWPPSAV
jgi:hypothetical protein